MALIEWQSTADACEYAALYGSTPAQIGDPDTRPILDEAAALPAIEEAMRTLTDITRAGTRLEDERDGLLWGFVFTLDRQRENLLKRANEVVRRVETLNEDLGRSHLSADTTGLEIIDAQLHDLVDEGERVLARGEAFADLHDQAMSVYEDVVGGAWRPQGGSKRRGPLFMGAAELDAREYRRSIDSKSVKGKGTRIVFSAGSFSERARGGGDRTWGPNPDVIASVVNAVRAAHPDMVVVTRTQGFGDERIADWARKHGIPTEQIVDKEALRRARIAGHVHFRSPAVGDDEAERTSIREAIPVIAITTPRVDRIDNAEITEMAAAWRPRENPIAELERVYERVIGAAYRLRAAARDDKVLVGRLPEYAQVMEQLKTLRLHRDLPARYGAAIDSLVERSRDEVRDPEIFFRAPSPTVDRRRSGARPAATNDLPMPEAPAAIAKIKVLFEHLREATRDGTQLADERTALMWGAVNTFHYWHDRVSRQDNAGHILPVVAHLKAAAIDEYERITRSPWLPFAGANNRESVTITAGQQRGNAFRAAVAQVKAHEEHTGPIVAVVGPMLPVDDAAEIPTRAAVYRTLDAVLERHPDVGIAITDAAGTNDVVRSWAQRHNLPLFVTRINWKQGTKAPYERNRALARLPLIGAVHFRNIKEESGIIKNVIDVLEERRIPIMAVDPAAEITKAVDTAAGQAAAQAAQAEARVAATAPLNLDEHCALLAANIDHRRARALDDGTSPGAIPGYRETIRAAQQLLETAPIPEPYRDRITDAVVNYRDECADPVAFAQRESARRVRELTGRKPADREVGESQTQNALQQTQNQSRGMRV